MFLYLHLTKENQQLEILPEIPVFYKPHLLCGGYYYRMFYNRLLRTDFVCRRKSIVDAACRSRNYRHLAFV